MTSQSEKKQIEKNSAADRVHHRLPNGQPKYTNHLAHETSPYLLQHAHNPVDWYPWGEAAFDAATQHNKPIFLSIGYSTCYWCHVMERQVFENEELAAQMNEQFINIKVDREERPDLDDIYMAATQAITQRGGWPMSVFLTPPKTAGEDDPGLKPFFAGTYFPPTPQHGMPAFPQVLDHLTKIWTEEHDEVIRVSDRLAQAVSEHLEPDADEDEASSSTGPSADLSPELVQRAAGQLMQMVDKQHGGFGGAPKFPTPVNLAFLFAVYQNNQDETILNVIHHALDRMARGGMYDQIGGGFHRYSVDEKWLVPHFEKMLYDNGQLLEVYADTYALDPQAEMSPLYRRVALEIGEYMIREMTDDTGAFYSAQDAEVNAMEGGNYVWTRAEVETLFKDEPELKQLALTLYGLDLGSNFQDPHHPDAQPVNVLFLPKPLAEVTALANDDMTTLLEMRREINARMLAVRDQREQPSTDDKVLVAWNGIMIAGLAKAGRILSEPNLIDAAKQAAEAIHKHMTASDGTLYRSMRHAKLQTNVPAFLEDYAWLIHGLLELYQATQDTPYLDRAIQHNQHVRDLFQIETGGYFDTLDNQTDLFVRSRSVYDGAIPCGNSVMVNNALTLYDLTQQAEFAQQAVRDLRVMAQAMRQNGANMANMHRALLRALQLGEDAFTATDAIVTVMIQPEPLEWSNGQANFEVTLHIKPGYHLNANTVNENLPALQPTQLFCNTPGYTLTMDYPGGQAYQPEGTHDELSIYQNTVTLNAILQSDKSTSGESPVLTLHYQPCTDTACQAATTLTIPLNLPTP